jgi:uncharacterized membrane protein YfcA
MTDWLSLVFDCLSQSWRIPPGDPGVVPWATTLGYVVAAAAAFRVASRGGDEMRERVFWIGMGLFLAFMAVNKQLDLQIWITATGRCIAREEGWYRQRRQVQAEFVLMLAIGLGITFATLLVWLRRSLRRNIVALVGLLVLSAFILQSAVSIHHLDRALHLEIGLVPAHQWVEICGVTLILIGIALLPRRSG